MFDGKTQVYVACGYTDLRRGIDGLVHIVMQQYQLNPMEVGVFLFCGRRADRFKALYWDKDGFVLLYKRLESGKYQWPRTPGQLKSLSSQEVRWLMEGLSIHQPKAHRPVKNIESF